MAYSRNPRLPRARMQAVQLIHQGWSTRQVARHFGITHSAVVKWVKKAAAGDGSDIPTLSSRPHRSPRALPKGVVSTIVLLRQQHQHYAEIIHQELIDRGIRVSLSSVKRTLKRHLLIRARSPRNGEVSRDQPDDPRPRAAKR